jgi:hypothetical protein
LLAICAQAGAASSIASLTTSLSVYDFNAGQYCQGPGNGFITNSGPTLANMLVCSVGGAFASVEYPLRLGAAAQATFGGNPGATSILRDRYTFDVAALNGTPGTLALSFDVSGSVIATGTDNALDATGLFLAYTTLEASGPPIDTTGEVVLGGGTSVSLLTHFTYGDGFYFFVQLSAGAYGRYPDTIAESNFGHTVKLGGFEFRDMDGAVVDNVIVASTSGTNPFVTAVPEPSLPLLTLVGLGLVGYAVRRRTAP